MPAELITTLRELRRSGRINEARELLARAQRDQPDPKLAFLAWQHAQFWWLPLQGKRVTLRRRGPEDAALVRRCWGDADFMGRFIIGVGEAMEDLREFHAGEFVDALLDRR